MLLEKIPPKATWNPIDEALYGPENPYRVKDLEADKLRLEAIKFSLTYHYIHNRFYNNLCKYREFKPEDVQALEDVVKIPLIPDTVFKGYPEPDKFIAWLRGISSDEVKYPQLAGPSYQAIIDRLNGHSLVVVFSSGSSGINTFIPKDPVTLLRASYFLKFALHLQKLGDPEAHYFWLGPNMVDSNWGVIYVEYNLHILPSYKPERTYVGIDIPRVTLDTFRSRILTKEITEAYFLRVIGMLEQLNKKGCKGNISGMPLTVNDFLSFTEGLGKNFQLGEEWILQTGGGWKRSEHKKISMESFWQRVSQVLGIPTQNCRDLYGMSESTVPFPSCEGHYYHIPHTVLHPLALDSELESVGFGEYGRFAFIDTLAHGYPGYIITGDRVQLLESCPACDRAGPVINPPITRMPGVEDRGCANVVRELMAEETHTA
jgi:hypothetical protein